MASNGYQFGIPSTQSQILSFFEEQVIASYIAPKRNKHIFGVMAYDIDNSFYFSPNYDYGTDAVHEEQQVVIIHDGGGEGGDLYWNDIV